jgi:hypothetical protein
MESRTSAAEWKANMNSFSTLPLAFADFTQAKPGSSACEYALVFARGSDLHFHGDRVAVALIRGYEKTLIFLSYPN